MQVPHRRRARLTSLLSAFALVLGVAFVQPSPAGATEVADIFELDGNPQESPDVADVGDDWETLDNDGGGAEAATDIPIFDGADSPTDTSYFKGGGSKDERNIGLWAYSGTDVAPDKDEIVNAAAAAYLVPDQTPDATTLAPNDGGIDGNDDEDLVIAFHSDRFSNDGDAAIGFWFLKKHIVPSGGKFKEDQGGTLVAGSHADGDVLVVSDFNEGEGINTIKVFTWTNGALVESPMPGTGSFDCQDEDPHNPYVCATENAAAVASVWPTLYTPKGNVGTPGVYPSYTFLEGGINTSAVLPNSDRCFATFLAETRSSTSTTAQLKDLVIGDFPVCAPSTTLTEIPPTVSPSVVLAGTPTTFTFTEKNDGNVGLTNVHLTTTTAGCTFLPESVSLAPGASQAFSCTVSPTADLTITATGHGTSPLGGDITFPGDPEERASASVDVIFPSTNLTVSTSPISPIVVHSGDPVVITFTETNDGTGADAAASLALSNPSVSIEEAGSACSPVGVLQPDGVHNVGDVNDNDLLDLTEQWQFQCTINPSADVVSLTGIGHGTVLGHDVTFVANCTSGTVQSSRVCDANERVGVSIDVINPSTQLTATASAVVTLTLKEKNDGDSPITNPTVSDEGCSADPAPTLKADLIHNVGDTGDDGILGVGEEWTYTCSFTLNGPAPTGVDPYPDTGETSHTAGGVGSGTDGAGGTVGYPADLNERDRVTVTLEYLVRG